MTDKKVESGPEGAGSSEQAKPEFQAQQGDQPASQSQAGTDDLEATVLSILEKQGLTDVQSLIEKQVQSQKDRRFQKHETRMDTLESQLERYNQLTGEGKLTHEDAIFRMQVEKFMQGQQQEQQATQPQVGNQQADWWVTAGSEMLKSAGVPENDPNVAAFIRGQKFASPQDYLAKLAGFVGQRTGGTGTGGALSMGGANNAALGQNDTATLRTAYKEAVSKIRRGDTMARVRLKTQFREKGYDPDLDPDYGS